MSLESLTTSDKLFLENIFFNLPMAAFLISRFGNIELVNTYACAITGYKKEELIDHNALMLIPERLRNERKALSTQYMANPHIVVVDEEIEVIYLTKPNTEILVNVAVSPIHHEEKGLLFLVLMRRKI